MENTNLIKQVKLLQVHRGLDGRGGIKAIAEAISVNRNSLSMALSGYRNGPGTVEMLEKARAYLETEVA